MDANFNSVSLLPFDRMAAITCERFFFEKTSAIDSCAHSTEGISFLKDRREIKGVVGPALDLDFLLEGVLLGLVVHVPAEGEPEFVNEVAARLLFLIGWGQGEFLVGPKIRHKLFHPCEGCIKPG
jgi:hypothetical protein